MDITPTAFNAETPNLSLSEETYCSNSIAYTAYTFVNFNEFVAYTFIYMISLIVIGILHTLIIQSEQPDSTSGASETFLLGGSGVAEGATHTDDSDTDTFSVISINDKDNDNPKKLLQTLKAKNSERPILAHININFLNPKFEPLKDIIKDNVDILLVSETKIDDTFPDGQFFIEGYKDPIRLDRNKNGGELLFFIHEDLDCKEITSHSL